MIDAETKPTGLLLAGGQSRRMSDAFAAGRGDKGLLDLSGKPMLGHVIERLAPQAGRLVINANGDPARFASFNLPVVPDTIEGYAGPLAGILAGLRWSIVNAPDATHVVSVSTDAPFLPADLVTKLQQGLANASGSIALAQSGGELHPVIGLWPVALADDLDASAPRRYPQSPRLDRPPRNGPRRISVYSSEGPLCRSLLQRQHTGRIGRSPPPACRMTWT